MCGFGTYIKIPRGRQCYQEEGELLMQLSALPWIDLPVSVKFMAPVKLYHQKRVTVDSICRENLTVRLTQGMVKHTRIDTAPGMLCITRAPPLACVQFVLV
jgi:hypothetical protein